MIFMFHFPSDYYTIQRIVIIIAKWYVALVRFFFLCEANWSNNIRQLLIHTVASAYDAHVCLPSQMRFRFAECFVRLVFCEQPAQTHSPQKRQLFFILLPNSRNVLWQIAQVLPSLIHNKAYRAKQCKKGWINSMIFISMNDTNLQHWPVQCPANKPWTEPHILCSACGAPSCSPWLYVNLYEYRVLD